MSKSLDCFIQFCNVNGYCKKFCCKYCWNFHSYYLLSSLISQTVYDDVEIWDKFVPRSVILMMVMFSSHSVSVGTCKLLAASLNCRICAWPSFHSIQQGLTAVNCRGRSESPPASSAGSSRASITALIHDGRGNGSTSIYPR